MVYAIPANAVHNEGVFQLDRNTATSPADGVADDWDRICKTAAPTLCTASTITADHAVARSFDTDVFGAGDNIFTGAQPGGSSKDPDPLSGWRYVQSTSSSAPDKDDIEHAYTALYHQANGDGAADDEALLYFGADRYAVSGDAQLGFWFFKDEVATAPKVGNVGSFTGDHTARDGDVRGDILILSDFLQGGSAPTVRVYEWVGSGGTDGSLDLIAGSTTQFADCLGAPNPNPKKPPVPPVGSNDNFCATVNIAPTVAPWPYTPKAGAANTMPAGAFYEGGVNLTALGLGDECFSSFLAETRSSQSPTATLKDFVVGGFGSCGAGLATDASDSTFEVGDGTTPTDTATISVNSTGSNPPAPEGDVDFFLCGPSTTAITSCDPTGLTAFDTQDLAGTDVSENDYSVTSDAVTDITSAGYYCFAARWEGDENYTDGPYADDGTNECFQVTAVDSSITTQVNDEDPVTPGTELYDTATLSGTVAPSNGVYGTITFNVYGPFADASTCTGDAVYTSVVTVDGNGPFVSRDGDADGDETAGEDPDDLFAPTDPGNYNWIANYTPDPGDVNNTASTGVCGDAHEGSVVQQFNPSLATAQTWTVKDTATVDVGGGGDLDGTAHFELHASSDCSDVTPLYTENVAVSGPSGTTADTTPFTITESAATLYWKVSYTSDNNPSHSDIDATCEENSSLTIDNGS